MILRPVKALNPGIEVLSSVEMNILHFQKYSSKKFKYLLLRQKFQQSTHF